MSYLALKNSLKYKQDLRRLNWFIQDIEDRVEKDSRINVSISFSSGWKIEFHDGEKTLYS